MIFVCLLMGKSNLIVWGLLEILKKCSFEWEEEFEVQPRETLFLRASVRLTYSEMFFWAFYQCSNTYFAFFLSQLREM